MSEETKVSLMEAEFTKINLLPGDVLFVKLVMDEIADHQLESFSDGLRKAFPNNQVSLVCMPPGEDITFTAIKQEQVTSCATSTNYCSDCNCGKKEAALKGE